MKNVLIAIINYANEEEVISYAQMLANQTSSNRIQLVIVNNKKSENAKINLAEEIQKINLSIELFEPMNNLGYLNGALYGYNEFISNGGTKPDWVIISNTDIVISDTLYFEKFLSIHYQEEIWCVAPSVYSPLTKSYQNPHYIERCSLNKINRIIFINQTPFLAYIYENLAKLKAKVRKTERKESQYVYSAHGCFFAVKGDFIDIIKDNGYKGFLYSEEAYIAEYLLIHGKKCFYDNNLEIVHNENSITGLLGINKRSKYIANSLKYIREEFY
ncbi:hypothetical protein [Paenibacillus sp. LPE1-1-1.1]|uniref:hypothetical protein n=1 Tax=Paenibacillus sp. LPE1-1-1.1 TaxID=3135230 RepID=UPI00342ABE52